MYTFSFQPKKKWIFSNPMISTFNSEHGGTYQCECKSLFDFTVKNAESNCLLGSCTDQKTLVLSLDSTEVCDFRMGPPVPGVLNQGKTSFMVSRENSLISSSIQVDGYFRITSRAFLATIVEIFVSDSTWQFIAIGVAYHLEIKNWLAD